MHNRYQKIKILKKKLNSDFNYFIKFVKTWLYCINIYSLNHQYKAIYKNTLGITYSLPLIDSINLGDKIRLYKNITRFYYFLKIGSVVPLEFLKTNFIISQVGFFRAQYAKANGTYIQINTLVQNFIKIILPSQQILWISSNFKGFLGRNSGIYSNKQYLGKSSNHRTNIVKTVVRSCAKNPVDHPNGGRTRGKMLIKTPWGKVARANK